MAVLAFHLSFRDVQDLPAERGMPLSSSAMRRSVSGAPSSVRLSLQGCVDDEREPVTSGIWTKWP